MRLAFWPLTHAFRFRGRSTRNEVVSFWLLSTLAEAGTLILDGPPPPLFYALGIAWSALWAWPWIPLLVRRLHDQGRGAWWALIPLSVAPLSALEWLTAPDGHAASISFHLGPLRLVKGLASTPWTIALMIVFIALAVANVLLFLWQPTRGANRFGPDPRLNHKLDRTEAVPVEA
ncbi:MAG TPA: DUF805 domain-containing protein [Sphingomonas sp.]|nr:DUF805 domain-containing protein [Sphingomonas sp.]